ncbi:hypothetical protein LWI28_022073 [Acer negundo]|uniref:Trafficking protein particle complex subunit 2 n=1 Tax=Acer negundo TaxID=4023 RepID=A0AAD5NY17_ACENE|nr:hypothetical protein LWI28_022073 [Acer negundo]
MTEIASTAPMKLKRFEAWMSHKDDAHFKLKSFPYYDELSMIFGKDRATGQHAETSADVKEKLQNKGGDYNLDDNASTENVDNLSFDSIYRFHFILNQVLRETGMASTACFIIVSRNDIPIYEAEVGSATKREDAAQLHQFILHAALDIVQDLAWTTSAMFLKAIDRFNDLVVSVYVTAGHTRLMLLHDSRNDDGIKSFFQEVHELYIKILLNPLYLPGSRIASSHFDTKVRALARKYL